MNSKAIDVVISELDKLAMCKRGVLATEIQGKFMELRVERNRLIAPKLTTDERSKIFAENRDALIKILEFKPSKQLTHMSHCGDERRPPKYRIDMFTVKSKALYQEAVSKLLAHPDYEEYVSKSKEITKAWSSLHTQDKERNAVINADFQSAKMNFISEKVSLKNFDIVFAELEQKEW